MSDTENTEDKKPIVIRNSTDLQRLRLEKLMKNPDKQIIIPEKPKEKGMPAVPDFVRNVMGSSAGAGSGEFHVYRHLRRKEYARQKYMKEKGEREKLEQEYHDKLDENRRKANEKTAKKRAKRQKRKQQLKNKKLKPNNSKVKSESSESEEDDSEEDKSDSGSDMKSNEDSCKKVNEIERCAEINNENCKSECESSLDIVETENKDDEKCAENENKDVIVDKSDEKELPEKKLIME